MDCMTGMKKFPDKYFDLAVCDPPYGIGEDGSKSKTRGMLAKPIDYKAYSSGDIAPDKEYFQELKRISKNQILFGANHYMDNLPGPLSSPCWIIWDKQRSGNFADCELAWTSFKTAVRIFRFMWNGCVVDNRKNKERRIHPNQKPKPLYTWIYRKYAKPDFKILDTHLGSASSAISAHHFLNENGRFVGFEKDPHYFNLACSRVKYATEGGLI